MRGVMRFAILLPVTVLLLAAIVWAVGFEETAKQMRLAGLPAFVSVGGLTLLFIVAQSLAWMLLNRPVGHRVRFRTLVEATTVGQAGNILTPSTYLGGEPLRVAYVGKMAGLPYPQVAGTVLLCKYLELLSFMLLFGFSAAVAALEYKSVLFRPPNLVGGITIVTVAGLLLGFCALLWVSLWRRWRPLTQMVRAAARVRLLRRLVARLWHRVAEMEDQTSRVFCEEGRTSFSAFGMMLASHALVFAKPLAFFLFGGRLRLGLGELCLIFAAGQLLLAVQLTPSGVGMLDGGLIAVFALLGYDTAAHAAMAMAYLLCLRLWDVAVIGIGALLAARAGARFLTAKPPPLLGAGACEKPGVGGASS